MCCEIQIARLGVRVQINIEKINPMSRSTRFPFEFTASVLVFFYHEIFCFVTLKGKDVNKEEKNNSLHFPCIKFLRRIYN